MGKRKTPKSLYFKRLAKLYNKNNGFRLTEQQLLDMEKVNDIHAQRLMTLTKPNNTVVNQLYLLKAVLEFACANIAAAQLENVEEISTDKICEYMRDTIDMYKQSEEI
jgi:hypothetical protein